MKQLFFLAAFVAASVSSVKAECFPLGQIRYQNNVEVAKYIPHHIALSDGAIVDTTNVRFVHDYANEIARQIMFEVEDECLPLILDEKTYDCWQKDEMTDEAYNAAMHQLYEYIWEPCYEPWSDSDEIADFVTLMRIVENANKKEEK